jgi:hypothetical protein
LRANAHQICNEVRRRCHMDQQSTSQGTGTTMQIPHHTGETASLHASETPELPGDSESQTSDMQACIELCSACHRLCLSAVTWCLRKGGAHATADHIRVLLDCAEICATSASFMLRQSERHASTCGVCAVVCRACADSCGKLEGDEMKRCAELCQRCAAACGKMSAGGPPA